MLLMGVTFLWEKYLMFTTPKSWVFVAEIAGAQDLKLCLTGILCGVSLCENW